MAPVISTHTAGPWLPQKSSYGWDIITNAGIWIASTQEGVRDNPHYPDAATVRANARLIGAAPALLAALRGCLNYIENTESELGIALDSGNAARAAIALALPPATDGGV